MRSPHQLLGSWPALLRRRNIKHKQATNQTQIPFQTLDSPGSVARPRPSRNQSVCRFAADAGVGILVSTAKPLVLLNTGTTPR